MDPDLLKLLMQWLLNRQTAGDAATGGEMPYDDYNLQGTIGGLGAPVPNPGMSFSNGIGDAAMDPTGYGSPAYGRDQVPVLDLPRGQSWLGGTTPAEGWVDVPISANLVEPRPKPVEQHPWPTGPFMWEDGTMRNPFSDQPGRPSFQPMPRNVFDQPSTAKKANPVAEPAPTAQPVAKFTDALPKNKQRATKPLPQRQTVSRAPQAARQIQQAAQRYVAPQPVRQFSAPSPAFTGTVARNTVKQR